jgi:hypothetical protein
MRFFKKTINALIGKIKHFIVRMFYAVVIIIVIFVIVIMLIMVSSGSSNALFSLGFFAASIFFYLLNNKLSKYFKKEKIQDFVPKEDAFPDVQKRKLNADVGIVPKWVSVFCFLSKLALIVAIVPWIPIFLKILLLLLKSLKL